MKIQYKKEEKIRSHRKAINIKKIILQKLKRIWKGIDIGHRLEEIDLKELVN